LKGILYSVVDILKENSVTLIASDYEKKVVREAFQVDVKDHLADLGARISRKKQIIPVLEAYFHPK
jgi:manganese-dependent inorganic pyrophosphatase